MQIILFFFLFLSFLWQLLKNSTIPPVDGPETEATSPESSAWFLSERVPLLLCPEFTATHRHENVEQAAESSPTLLNLEKSGWQEGGKCSPGRGLMLSKV